MVDVTVSIPAENVAEIVETIKWLKSIPQIKDPEWEYSEEVPEAQMIDEFTENQWAKEFIRRWLIQNVKNKRKSIAAAEARDTVDAVGDDFVE